MAGDIPVLGQIALGVLARLEEVEHVAAAAEARPLATGAPAQHHRLLRLPPGTLAGIESQALTGSREWISIATPSIGAIPSASIAHIASTQCFSSIRTRCPRGFAENGYATTGRPFPSTWTRSSRARTPSASAASIPILVATA